MILVNLVYLLIKNSFSKDALKIWFNQTIVGFEKGALNMVGVGIAIATAGIIVGAVGSTGLSTNLIIVIESIAKDNVTILLFLTIILCLLLGMGLPTTANYVVVASLMATVLVDVGNASGLFSTYSSSFVCILFWFNGRCYSTCRFSFIRCCSYIRR